MKLVYTIEYSKTHVRFAPRVLQYAAIYNRWTQLARPANLTAALINQLGHILCGASPEDIAAISLDDFEYIK